MNPTPTKTASIKVQGMVYYHHSDLACYNGLGQPITARIWKRDPKVLKPFSFGSGHAPWLRTRCRRSDDGPGVDPRMCATLRSARTLNWGVCFDAEGLAQFNILPNDGFPVEEAFI